MWRWTRRTAPSCSTTSSSRRPAARMTLSFSGSPAATTAPYSAASPWRSVRLSLRSQALTRHYSPTSYYSMHVRYRNCRSIPVRRRALQWHRTEPASQSVLMDEGRSRSAVFCTLHLGSHLCFIFGVPICSWQTSSLWIHRLGQDFPFPDNPKAIMLGKYLPHCSSMNSSSRY